MQQPDSCAGGYRSTRPVDVRPIQVVDALLTASVASASTGTLQHGGAELTGYELRSILFLTLCLASARFVHACQLDFKQADENADMRGLSVDFSTSSNLSRYSYVGM